MNNFQIDKILGRNKSTAPYYLGCFPSDKLDRVPSKYFPLSFVVNFDPSWEKGSHWVAIFAESPHSVDYYDSLGIWPPPNENISRYLSNFNQIEFNPYAFQEIGSRNCGKHAIFFLYNRSIGKTMNEILQFLIDRGMIRKTSPDRIVSNFLNEKIFDQ